MARDLALFSNLFKARAEVIKLNGDIVYETDTKILQIDNSKMVDVTAPHFKDFQELSPFGFKTRKGKTLPNVSLARLRKGKR